MYIKSKNPFTKYLLIIRGEAWEIHVNQMIKIFIASDYKLKT